MSKMKNIPLEKREFPFIDPRSDELVYRNAFSAELCCQTLSGFLYENPAKDWKCKSFEKDENPVSFDNIVEDLEWLLCLSHAKFWCQVINDESVHALLNSYLRKAPRFQVCSIPASLQEKHNTVHRLVFLVFLRMSTPNESDEAFISKSIFGALLYDNFLFDIPRIMDICALYGRKENIKLIRKMINNIFQCQPHYNDDLHQAASTVLQVILHIEEKCASKTCGSQSTDMPAVLSGGLPQSLLFTLPQEDFEDIVLFLSDVTHTLKSFIVDVYPVSSKVFLEIGLIDKLLLLFTTASNQLKIALAQQSFDSGVTKTLDLHIRLSQDNIVIIIYNMIKTCLYDPLCNAAKKTDAEKISLYTEKFITVSSSLLGHQQFLKRIKQKFDFGADINHVLQICPDIEVARAEYLLQEFEQKPNVLSVWKETQNQAQDCERDIQKATEPSSEKSATDDDLKVMLLVSSIQELLPDLGSGFVRACLHRLDYDSEKVIQLVLEDNLPDDLQNLDRSASANESDQHHAITTEEDPEQAKDIPETSQALDLVSQRKNIHDHDQFDIFNSDQPLSPRLQSQIYRGKKEKSNIDHWRTEDQVQRLTELYSKYEIVNNGSEEEDYNVEVDELINYEDEYDDTYDALPVAANDQDDEDDLLSRRIARSKPIAESSEEEAEEESKEKRRQNFITNPEVIRAQQEARRQQRLATQQPHRRKKQDRKPKETTEEVDREKKKKAHDIERKRKEANKSYKANHNRKKMAAKKSAQGM